MARIQISLTFQIEDATVPKVTANVSALINNQTGLADVFASGCGVIEVTDVVVEALAEDEA